MKHYIVNYEIWLSNASIGWGNCDMTVTGPDDSAEFLRTVIDNTSKQCGVENAKIRIVGIFKL